METIYYHLDARRLSGVEAVSGEERDVYRVTAPVRPKRAAGNNVLDFTAYRQAHETHADSLSEPEVSHAEPACETTKGSWFAGWMGLTLDACATAALVAVCVAVAVQFLRLM